MRYSRPGTQDVVEISVLQPALGVARRHSSVNCELVRVNITGTSHLLPLPQRLTLDSGTVSPGINFKRDDSNPTSLKSTHSDCEGSAILPILGAFTASGVTGLTNALVDKLGSDLLDAEVPASYTAAGWNATSS